MYKELCYFNNKTRTGRYFNSLWYWRLTSVKPDVIARETVDLGKSSETDENLIVILGVIASKDHYKYNARYNNDLFNKLCSNSRNITFVDLSNIDDRAHINYGASHWNFRGLKIIGKRVINIEKFLNL